MFYFIFAMISIWLMVNYKGDSKKNYLLYGTILGTIGGTLSSYVNKATVNALPKISDYIMYSFMYSLIIVGGLILAEKTKLPTWFNKDVSIKKQLLVGVLSGVLLGIYLYITNIHAAGAFLEAPHEGAAAFVESLKRVKSPIGYSLM